MAHNAEFVDDEKSAQGNSVVIEDFIVARNGFCDIRDHRELDIADAAFFRFRGFPCKMGIFRVDGNGNHFAVSLFEFIKFFVECNDFRRAHECEVHRIEEQHDILASVLGKRKRCNAEVGINGVCGEIGCFSGN